MPEKTWSIELKFDEQSPWVRPGRSWEKWYPPEIPRTIKYPEVPIFEILNKADIYINSFKQVLPTLEDVFLSIVNNTGKIWE